MVSVVWASLLAELYSWIVASGSICTRIVCGPAVSWVELMLVTIGKAMPVVSVG